MIKLGVKAKDRITGFTGIITVRAQYITGCDQYGLQPPMDDKGGVKKIEWFDEGRLEILDKGVSKEDFTAEDPGGLNRDCPEGYSVRR